MESQLIRKVEISISATNIKLMIMRKGTQVKERGNRSFFPFLQDSSPLVPIKWENVSSHLDVLEADKHRCLPEINMVWIINRSKTITKLVKKLLTITMQVRWVLKGHLYRTHNSRSVIKCITKTKNSLRISLNWGMNNAAFNQSINASNSWRCLCLCLQVTLCIRPKYLATR